MGLLSDSKSTVNTNTNNYTSNEDSRQASTDQGVSVRIDGTNSGNIQYNYTSSDPTLAADVASAGTAAVIAASGSIRHTAGAGRDMSRDVSSIAATNAGTLAVFSRDQATQQASQLQTVRYLADQVTANNRQFLDEVNT